MVRHCRVAARCSDGIQLHNGRDDQQVGGGNLLGGSGSHGAVTDSRKGGGGGCRGEACGNRGGTQVRQRQYTNGREGGCPSQRAQVESPEAQGGEKDGGEGSRLIPPQPPQATNLGGNRDGRDRTTRTTAVQPRRPGPEDAARPAAAAGRNPPWDGPACGQRQHAPGRQEGWGGPPRRRADKPARRVQGTRRGKRNSKGGWRTPPRHTTAGICPTCMDVPLTGINFCCRRSMETPLITTAGHT